ncbi:uncharacterized protein [Spinacia oleracea]|uniref:RNase H type-1 domain-containing protein n=1 Tax=Spinacia oleracea TaxID=3562 RepID=A0ABM3R8Q7_SPIOL|nr:uncharacterized protein LOC110788269 [Spinacia oleracea]
MLNTVIPQIAPTCARCSSNSETHIHIFRDCHTSSILWNFIFQRLGIPDKFNYSIFQNSPWGKGKEKVEDSSINSLTWLPPAPGFLKLNTDGAWKGIDKTGGGGVLRKENGDWFLGYSSKYNAKNPLAAELLALREGLSVAKSFDIDKLEVETDAGSLIFMLDTSTVNPYPHHELVAVIEEVRGMLLAT